MVTNSDFFSSWRTFLERLICFGFVLITFVRFNEGLNKSSVTYLLSWELYVPIISVNYGYENILKQMLE